MWHRLSNSRQRLIIAAIVTVATFSVITSVTLAFLTPSLFEGGDGNLEGVDDWKGVSDAGLVAVGHGKSCR